MIARRLVERSFFSMVAGPNGSGKTTLTNALRRTVDLGLYINADEFVERIAGGTDEWRAKRAQTEALRAVDEALTTGRSFTFETVMSHPSKIALLRQAREHGFFVRLFFVGTSDSGINLTRVAARVVRGGHDVPDAKVRARYLRSMDYLHQAAVQAHEGAIFDNSSPYAHPEVSVKPLTLIGSFSNTEAGCVWDQRVQECPGWVKTYFLSRIGHIDG